MSSHPPTEAALAAARAGAVPVRFKAGDVLFRPGDRPKGWIVISSGRARVDLTADTGREVTLYRLAAGDSCLMTTSALLGYDTLLAEAVAETDLEGLLVPFAVFERFMGEDADFRRAVLKNYAERMADLVLMVQDVLFHALPRRLARLLLEPGAGEWREITHQALAKELGSAREVVSRVLARFEREGLIETERGRLRLLDAPRLRRMAEEAP